MSFIAGPLLFWSYAPVGSEVIFFGYVGALIFLQIVHYSGRMFFCIGGVTFNGSVVLFWFFELYGPRSIPGLRFLMLR